MTAAPLTDRQAPPPAAATPLLEVAALSKSFPVRLGFRKTGYVSAVDRVSFRVESGTTLGIVGESGCGKSTAARLILGLLPIDDGEVLFDGRSVTPILTAPAFRGQSRRKALRRNMQMVFQDPYSSLNPRSSIGEIIAFPMRVHRFPKDESRERVGTLLEQVGLHRNHASYYPHQMSGGQRQRVNIARALALEAEARDLRRGRLRPRQVRAGAGAERAAGPPG